MKSGQKKSKDTHSQPANLKRVHVTLSQEVLDNPELIDHLKQELIQNHNMSDVNEKRLKRYGIMSGTVPENMADGLRQMKHVESVDLDETRHAMD